MPCYAKDFGDFVVFSEITDCGKSEQNPASSKISSKTKFLTTKDFYYLPGNSLINGCIVL